MGTSLGVIIPGSLLACMSGKFRNPTSARIGLHAKEGKWEAPSLGVHCVSENGNIYPLAIKYSSPKGRPRESHHPAAHSRNLHALSTGPLPSRPTHQRMPAPALQPSACGKEPETLSVGRQGWGRGCSTPPVGLGAGQGGAHRGESSAPPPPTSQEDALSELSSGHCQVL